jgi:hypothetical protein
MNRCAIVITLLLLSAPALYGQAGCVDVATVAGTLFDYAICDVPDIDQRRAASADGIITGLPNEGAMYCVPTSAMNFFAYLAHHPLAPLPEPGPQAQNWETSDPPVYNDMTANLMLLGSMMKTDPVGGTGGFGGLTGMQEWLAANGADEEYLVNLFYAVGDYSPRLVDMAKSALGGALVMGGVGWYVNADNAEPKTRSGGHLVSLVGASGDANATTHTMVIHDPAGNDSKTMQAPFVRRLITTEDVTGTFDGEVRTHSRTVGYGSGYIDGYFTIAFNWGLLFDNLKFVVLSPFENPLDPVTRRFDPVGPVIDLAMHPQRTTHPYLVERSSTIWQIDALNGVSTRLANVGQARALELSGSDQTLYVLTKNHIVALDWEGRRKGRVLLRDDVEQIAWDASRNELLAASLSSARLYRFSAGLEAIDAIDLPPVDGTGRLHMSVDPRSGVLWLLREGAAAALRITGARGRSVIAERVPLSGVVAAESLSVGHNGLVYVSDGGRIRVFDAAGEPEPRSRFNGLPGGALLELPRSFSNFDPAIHTGPAWRNVLPPETR